VVLEEASAVCGPLAMVGAQTGCLRCWLLQQCDQDEQWAAIATQMAATTSLAKRGEDPLLAGIVGSYAAGQVVGALAGETVTCHGNLVRFTLPGLLPTISELPQHERCDCTGLV
jgi:hypothetical protein